MFAGVFLILLGVLVLAGQFALDIPWWALWPLIIVLAGMVQALTPGKEGWSVERVFDGLTTVAWGVFFLTLTTGIVSWSVWFVLLSLWPVILIAIGLDLLAKALHTGWFKLLGSAVVIAALVYASLVSLGDAPRLSTMRVSDAETYSMQERVDDVEEADLIFDSGLSDVRVKASDSLVEAKGRSSWGEPTVEVERTGDQASVKVRSGEGNHVAWIGEFASELDLGLSRTVLWDAVVSTGVSSLDADLTDVRVKSLVLKPGVAECSVDLGDVPDGLDESRVEVRAGVASVKLRFPEDAQVRIVSKGGLSTFDVSADFEDDGDDAWQTDGFDQARAAGDPVWLVDLEAGLGTIVVDTY